MQEMAQESDAIENRDFNAARFVIFRTGIFANFVGHRFGGNKDVVLNMLSLRGDFLKRAVNVAALHGFILHFIARHDFVIAKHRDLNVANRAGLFIGGIVSGKIEHALAKSRFRGFVSGGDNQDRQTT